MDARETRPALPRMVAAIILGAITLASLASLAGPAIAERINGRATPTGAGVVRRVIEDPESAGRIGAPAPDFEWNAPDGTVATLATFRGEPLVINFWATWCVPCREEMPALERAAAADPRVTVLAVDLQEDGERVRGFVDSLALRHLRPILDTDGAVTRRFAVFSLPSTFFIAADGTVAAVHIGGPMTPEVIAAGIAKARSVAPAR